MVPPPNPPAGARIITSSVEDTMDWKDEMEFLNTLKSGYNAVDYSVIEDNVYIGPESIHDNNSTLYKNEGGSKKIYEEIPNLFDVPGGYIFKVAYGDDGNFVATRGNSTSLFWYSSDGKSWVEGDCGGTIDTRAVAYGEGLWVMGGNRDWEIRTSPDLINWTSRLFVSTPTPDGFSNITYANGYFVGAGYYGKGYYSADGISWSAINFPTTDTMYEIAFGNGIWVIGSEDGKLYSSTNLTTWTLRSSGISTDYLRTVAFGNGYFYAARDEQILRSANGINWTHIATLDYVGTHIVFNPDNNKFYCGMAAGHLIETVDFVSGTRYISTGDTRGIQVYHGAYGGVDKGYVWTIYHDVLASFKDAKSIYEWVFLKGDDALVIGSETSDYSSVLRWVGEKKGYYALDSVGANYKLMGFVYGNEFKWVDRKASKEY